MRELWLPLPDTRRGCRVKYDHEATRLGMARYLIERGLVCAKWSRDIEAFIRYLQRLPHYGDPRYIVRRMDTLKPFGPGNVTFGMYPEPPPMPKYAAFARQVEGVTRLDSKIRAMLGGVLR